MHLDLIFDQLLDAVGKLEKVRVGGSGLDRAVEEQEMRDRILEQLEQRRFLSHG